jgi:hypothetical protein
MRLGCNDNELASMIRRSFPPCRQYEVNDSKNDAYATLWLNNVTIFAVPGRELSSLTYQFAGRPKKAVQPCNRAT